MQYAELGRTGLRVSRLCLGTMNFGPRCSEADAFAIMDRALELGINFFDTADRYGVPVGSGQTESIIGRWLALGDRRDRIVLATKLYGVMGPGANDRGLSAYYIRRACEASLRRLQTDHIDLYQMHHVDLGVIAPHQRNLVDPNVQFWDPPHAHPGAPWEEIWQGMEQLVHAGKITYVGSSNFAAWNVVQANERARERHFLGLISEQSIYNLTKRWVELEMLPVCKEYGVGFLCWSPLQGGRLAGNLGGAEGRRAEMHLHEHEQKQLDEYLAVCRDLGEEPANVALAWLLHNPVVTGPIIGPRTIEQLEGAVHATGIVLPEDVLKRLDAIFPGPGGPAPMAYAW